MTQEFYVLGNDRSSKVVRGFLDHFLPDREPCCGDYPVPENADAPQCILRSEYEIFDYMERHSNEPYGLYWNDASATSTQAMVFYTRDGYVIFGFAEDTSEPTKRLKELAAFVGAKYSTLGSEQRPPDTAKEFITLCSV